MNHQDLASALLVGTSLSQFTFVQDAFILRFSRWSRQESLGHRLPFDVLLDAQGSMHIRSPAHWGMPQSNQTGSDEALIAAGLVRLCQSGEAAQVSVVTISGPDLTITFAGGVQIVVNAAPDMMGPDWVIAESQPEMPPTIHWSVYSEGGRVDSKRP